MGSTGTLYERLSARADTASTHGKVRNSASVVPWRETAGGRVEVFWVRRAAALRFMGGWHAFPGGALDRADADVPIFAGDTGQDDTIPAFHAPDPSLDPNDSAIRQRLGDDLAPGILVCAVRELFEESGLLLADGVRASSDLLTDARTRLLDSAVGFGALVEEFEWRLNTTCLDFAGRWLTPPLSPMRFDNRFFLLHWPESESIQPTVVPGELDHGTWIDPAGALASWRAGDVLAAPPIVHILRVLSEDHPSDALARLRDPQEANLGPMRRIAFRPGVLQFPVRTPTLPPATHTNTFVLGNDPAVLVDPASPLPDEQAKLFEAFDAARERDGVQIGAIWLSHHHGDHIGAVQEARQRLGVPVLAHADSIDPLRRQGIEVDDTLADNQRVELGGDPPLVIRVLHTPGHTRGHLAFLDERTGTILCGDLVSALSTIVIDPPEGDMDAYLASLAKLETLSPSLLLPAHGPPILRATEKLRWYRKHRLEREAQVLTAWRDGCRDATAMVPTVYPGLAPMIMPVAARQIEAHLARLRNRGELA